MSFRRQGKSIHENARSWEAWRHAQSETLAKTGLPELVLQDEEHWWDFLAHGYLDHHEDPLRFTVHQLSLEEQSELRNFLQETLSADEKASAIVLRILENVA